MSPGSPDTFLPMGCAFRWVAATNYRQQNTPLNASKEPDTPASGAVDYAPVPAEKARLKTGTDQHTGALDSRPGTQASPA